MSVKLSKLMDYLHSWADPATAAKWDNVGLQIGDPNSDISSVSIALDLDPVYLKSLSEKPPELVITHHPIFFSPIKSIAFDGDMDQILSFFLSHRINLFSMHTNLDAAPGGVSDTLVSHYGFGDSPATPFGSGDYGRLVSLETACSFEQLASVMPGRQVGAQANSHYDRIVFGGGSGKSLLDSMAKDGLDLLITGEIGYHDEIFAAFHGITVLLLGHRESESIICPVIAQKLSQAFPDLEIASYQNPAYH